MRSGTMWQTCFRLAHTNMMETTKKILFVVLVIVVSMAMETEGLTKRKRKFGCVLPEEPLYGHFEFVPKRKEIIYHCDPGYELYFMMDNYRNCRKRKWTGTHGDCRMNYYDTIRCQKPEAPKHGHVSYFENEDGTGEASFWCEPGYRLIGAKQLKCENRKEWTGGTFPICRSQQTVEDLANILKEDFFDPLAATTADAGENDVQGKLAVGKTGLDIIMLMDVSASIGKKSLETAKNFIKLIVEQFSVSPDASGGKNGTRVALITFSTKAETVFELDDKDVRSVDAVNKKIDAIQTRFHLDAELASAMFQKFLDKRQEAAVYINEGGGTNLADALSKAALMGLFKLTQEKNRFAESTRAVFIVTDAETTFTQSATKNKKSIEGHVKTLKGQSFEIFAIGVGKHIDRDTLESIATEPTDEHVFLTNEFKDLDRVRDIIAEKNIDYGQCGISGNFEIQRDNTESKKGAWPWLGWLAVVMIKDKETGTPDLSVTCGGTLLCDRWFLTVAHCVSFVDGNGAVHVADTKTINVNLGDHNIYKSNDVNHIITGVQEIHLHPSYTGVESEHGVREFDVALLDLGDKTAVPLNKFIRPICFPTEVKQENETDSVYGTSAAMLQSLLRNNRKGFTAGWGHAPINVNLAKLPWGALSQVRRGLQKHERCLKRFPGLDTDKFFCVFNSFGETSYCRGDVGGPFMDEMANDRFTVLGLAARTHDCTEDDGFSIFLNVINPEISDWVGDKLDGCNRVPEDEGWSERMRKKWDAIKKEREEAENGNAADGQIQAGNGDADVDDEDGDNGVQEIPEPEVDNNVRGKSGNGNGKKKNRKNNMKDKKKNKKNKKDKKRGKKKDKKKRERN